MYFKDIHILVYLLVGLIGCVLGQVVGLLNERLMNHEKIIEKGSLKRFKREFVPHYLLMTIMFILFVGLLYICGPSGNWHSNIKVVSYFLLMPMLVSAFIIDWKKKIIPNRLVLTIFELRIIGYFF